MAYWNYARFVRYVANNTDSEQMLKYSNSELDERTFVDNAVEYLGRFWGTELDREYTPEEWRTGRPGKPMAIDLIRTKNNEFDTAIEVKFVRDRQSFASDIVDDLLRLLSLQNVRERYLLIGGHKKKYQDTWEKSEILNGLLPLDHDKRFGKDREKSKLAVFWKKAQYKGRGKIEVDLDAEETRGKGKKKGHKIPVEVVERFKKQKDKFNTEIDLKFEIELKAYFCPRGDWGIDDPMHETIPFVDVRLWKVTPLR